MTVEELIEVLQPMNSRAVVMIGDGEYGECFAVRLTVSEECPLTQGKGKRVVIRKLA